MPLSSRTRSCLALSHVKLKYSMALYVNAITHCLLFFSLTNALSSLVDIFPIAFDIGTC